MSAPVCSAPGCDLTGNPATAFCAVHSEELLRHLELLVTDTCKVAGRIYLGRTGFPERRLLEHFANHGRSHLLLLLWAGSWDEAEFLEEALIRRFEHLSKLANESLESTGSFTSHWNALYLSFTPKAAIRALPGALDVPALHWRRRIWPDPMFPGRPILLRSGARSRDGARQLLDEWDAFTRRGRRRGSRGLAGARADATLTGGCR